MYRADILLDFPGPCPWREALSKCCPGNELDELFSDWKADAGLGLRAMCAGAVVRLDVAVSDEGTNAWVMFGHPF